MYYISWDDRNVCANMEFLSDRLTMAQRRTGYLSSAGYGKNAQLDYICIDDQFFAQHCLFFMQNRMCHTLTFLYALSKMIKSYTNISNLSKANPEKCMFR